MADIDMVGGSDFSMDKTRESPVQNGGGGEIQFYGGSDFHMSHDPISTEQKSGGSGDIDFVGQQGLLNHKRVSLYGAEYPTDKGE